VRVLHDPETRPCYACRERADLAVARGHRTWYTCWEHATPLFERGAVIVGGDVRERELRRRRERGT
jgi:hypothetical protein